MPGAYFIVETIQIRDAEAKFPMRLHTGWIACFADVAIAAALAHGLLLLTRNGKHFEPLGVAFSDLAEQLPYSRIVWWRGFILAPAQ